MSNHTHYYLMSLEAPLLNISFPMTAIPVECHMLPGKQEVMILLCTYLLKLICNYMFHANTECLLVPNNHIGVIRKNLGPKPLDD